jgi:hypothetical protein
MSSADANGRPPDASHPDQAEPQGTDDGVEILTEFSVINEFAGVRVRKVRTRGGERLEISSSEYGHSIRLDALALEGLSWQSPETISSYLETPFGPEDDESTPA